MLAVAAGELGVVAIGADESMAVVWFLDDAGNWDYLPMMSDGTAYLQDVIAVGSELMVVGYEVADDGEEPVLWRSWDAWTWLGGREFISGGPGDQVVYAVAEYPNGDGVSGFVAAGDDWSGGDVDGVVWISPDGVEWTRVDAPAFGGPGDQLLYGVAVGGPGLVAVGREDVGETSRPLVCVSADGQTWTRIEDESVFAEYQGIFEVVNGSPGLVAVGVDGSDGTANAAVWVSEDGYQWSFVQQDAFGGPFDQVMLSVASGESGLIAVGLDASRGGDPDAAVWVSADGITWSQVPHDEEIFGGEGDQRMWDVAVFGGVLVAVGDDYSGGDADAAVWVSPPPG